jgi:preprotein translocase subunit SecA
MGFEMHDVQIQGAFATALGAIIEMQTGEGKTVVSGLAAVLRTALDPSVHVATTTDYLAERDHEGVAPIFNRLGLESAVLVQDANLEQTQAAYQKAVVYGPGYLFGFDYLRDQMAIREAEETTLGRDVLESMNGTNLNDRLAQSDHYCIIVDEADSVLIDEATTPLVLSGSTNSPEPTEAFLQALEVARQLEAEIDFECDLQKRKAHLLSAGQEKIYEALRRIGRIELARPWSTYIEHALYAEYLLVRDEHYVVRNDGISLVDQFTGRIFDDRMLRGGLHQAVEAKEGLEVNPPNRSIARITRQRFFQLYETVCGMTGTVEGSEQELQAFYSADVVRLQPHQPSKRIELPSRFFVDWDSKLKAIVAEIESLAKLRRPILVGTRTIRESHLVDDALRDVGIDAIVLNGVQDANEAAIVSEAGKAGSIMIATNMAGRGTDVKLTEEARQLGGLHVLATSRNVSNRIDRQLAGRAARQGDPGSCQFLLAADDEIFAKYDQKLGNSIASGGNKSGENNRNYSPKVSELQGEIERLGYESRRRLVHHDNWMDKIREVILSDQ